MNQSEHKQHKHSVHKLLFTLEHVRTLYTPRTATQNIYSARIFVVQLRLQDFDLLNYLLVDCSEGKTGVSGKESV